MTCAKVWASCPPSAATRILSARPPLTSFLNFLNAALSEASLRHASRIFAL